MGDQSGYNSAERQLIATALLWRQRAILFERLAKGGLDRNLGQKLDMAINHNTYELRKAGELP